MPEFRRVLVADDVEVNRLVIRAILEGAGHRVDTAADGWAALAAATVTAYDAIVLDLAMPGLDGIAAAAAIRALEGREDRTPAIILALTASEGAGEDCRTAGMDAMLTKPIDPPALLAHLTPSIAPAGLPWSRLATLRRSLQREAGDPAATARTAAAIAALAAIPPLSEDGGLLLAAARRLETLALTPAPADRPGGAVDAVLSAAGRGLAAWRRGGAPGGKTSLTAL